MPAPKEDNPLWALRMGHFGPCHYVFRDYSNAKRRFLNPLTQEAAADEFFAYVHLWMALLYVTVEGFLDLKVDDPAIKALLCDERVADLRRFRNSVFHPQKTFKKREGMHELAKLNWVHELHAAFVTFFSAQDEIPDA